MRTKTQIVEDYFLAAVVVCGAAIMFAATIRFIFWIFA